MKTKCPHCNTVQSAPDEAAGRDALCRSCRKVFTITEYTSPVIVPMADLPSPADLDDIPITVDAPPPKDRSGNILSRAWTGIPAPFKTSFLATLGVVSALLFAWYVLPVSRMLHKSPDPANGTVLANCIEDFGRLFALRLVVLSGSATNHPPTTVATTECVIHVIQSRLKSSRLPTTDPDLHDLQLAVKNNYRAFLDKLQYANGLILGTVQSDSARNRRIVEMDDATTTTLFELLDAQKARFGLAD